MATQDRGFNLRPGDGWLFWQAGRENQHFFQGHMRLDDTTEVQVQATLDLDKQKYDCVIREFGTWRELTKFELPQLKDQPFVDSEFKIAYEEPIEVQGMKVKERKYQVRAYKGQTQAGETVLRMRLPQVQKRTIRRDIPL